MQNGSVGGREEVIPVDVRLSKGIRGRVKLDPKGDCVAYNSLQVLTVNAQSHGVSKDTLGRLSRTGEAGLNGAGRRATIIVVSISIVTVLMS